MQTWYARVWGESPGLQVRQKWAKPKIKNKCQKEIEEIWCQKSQCALTLGQVGKLVALPPN